MTTLSSSNPGGSTAKASVITTGPSTPVLATLLCTALLLSNCYTVSVVAPTSFSTSPAGGNNNVNFTSSLVVEGTSGLLSRILLTGTFAVEVNMTATRTSGMFPVGNYQAMPTIRCE